MNTTGRKSGASTLSDDRLLPMDLETSTPSCAAEFQAVNRSFATLVLDPAGHGVRANDKFLNSLGYQPGDVAGLTLAMLSPPLDGLAVTARREWQAVLAGQLSETERLRLRKD